MHALNVKYIVSIAISTVMNFTEAGQPPQTKRLRQGAEPWIHSEICYFRRGVPLPNQAYPDNFNGPPQQMNSDAVPYSPIFTPVYNPKLCRTLFPQAKPIHQGEKLIRINHLTTPSLPLYNQQLEMVKNADNARLFVSTVFVTSEANNNNGSIPARVAKRRLSNSSYNPDEDMDCQPLNLDTDMTMLQSLMAPSQKRIWEL